MKKLLIIVLMTLITQYNGFTQCDEENILSLLNSVNPEERALAGQLISECQLIDFSNILIDKLETEQFLYPTTSHILALKSLGYEDIYSVTEDFINRIEELQYFEYDDLLESKVVANSILVLNLNFNYYNYVMEIVERDRPNLSLNTINCLLNTLLVNAQHYDFAKKELYNAMSNSNNYLTKSIAINVSAGNNLNGFYNFIVEQCLVEEDESIRNQIYDLLLENQYLPYHEFLYSRALEDQDYVNRIYLSSKLLELYCYPIDLKSLESNLEREKNVDVITAINYRIEHFIPPRPTVTTEEMIDTLISFTTQLFKYNWIKDSTNYKSYLSELENQKKFDIEKDEDNLNDSIEHFLEMVEGDRKSEVLTEEGYKYLHYYEIYIKENVDEKF